MTGSVYPERLSEFDYTVEETPDYEEGADGFKLVFNGVGYAKYFKLQENAHPRFSLIDNQTAYLEYVKVEDQLQQRHGYGKAIMAKTLEHISDAGLRYCRMSITDRYSVDILERFLEGGRIGQRTYTIGDGLALARMTIKDLLNSSATASPEDAKQFLERKEEAEGSLNGMYNDIFLDGFVELGQRSEQV
ncbi:MAG TPA: hypothetical protein VLG27_01000 [Candidatus Saccharimonadia bacterium]|nr:hypothetical protein [Candidatus Saccharimonadia bacterium]